MLATPQFQNLATGLQGLMILAVIVSINCAVFAGWVLLRKACRLPVQSETYAVFITTMFAVVVTLLIVWAYVPAGGHH